MQRRLVIILTFPLIVSFFLIGWVLYCIGGKGSNRKNVNELKSNVSEKKAELTNDEDIEIGLVEEVREEISV